MRRLSLLIVALATAVTNSESANASDKFRVVQGNASSSYTNWLIEHDKEDGTSNDICIMTAFWPWMRGNVAIRKDVLEPAYKLRVVDPDVSLFAYGDKRSISILVTREKGLSLVWHTEASGIGAVYDIHFPKGPEFDRFTDQLFNSESVTFDVDPAVKSHVFTARLGNAREAWGILQDCLSSLSSRDGRW